jgi:hypothetical protein
VEDLRVMQVGRWWEKVRSKEEWRRIVREAKAHPGPRRISEIKLLRLENIALIS